MSAVKFTWLAFSAFVAFCFLVMLGQIQGWFQMNPVPPTQAPTSTQILVVTIHPDRIVIATIPTR